MRGIAKPPEVSFSEKILYARVVSNGNLKGKAAKRWFRSIALGFSPSLTLKAASTGNMQKLIAELGKRMVDVGNGELELVLNIAEEVEKGLALADPIEWVYPKEGIAVPVYMGRAVYLSPWIWRIWLGDDHQGLSALITHLSAKLEAFEGIARHMKDVVGNTRKFSTADEEALATIKEVLNSKRERDIQRNGCAVCRRKNSSTIHHLIPRAFAEHHKINNDFYFSTLSLCQNHHAMLEEYITELLHTGKASLYDLLLLSLRFTLTMAYWEELKKEANLYLEKTKRKHHSRREDLSFEEVSQLPAFQSFILGQLNEALEVKRIIEERKRVGLVIPQRAL